MSKIEELTKRLGDAITTKLFKTVEEKEGAAVAAGLRAKGHDPEVTEKDEEEEVEGAEFPGGDEQEADDEATEGEEGEEEMDADTAALAGVFSEALSPFAESLEELTGAVQALLERDEARAQFESEAKEYIDDLETRLKELEGDQPRVTAKGRRPTEQSANHTEKGGEAPAPDPLDTFISKFIPMNGQ